MRTPVRGYAARHRFLGLNPAMIAAIAVVLAFGGLWVSGAIDPMRFFAPAREISHRGQIAIPVSAVGIPAFTKITRDHLWNGKAGVFSVIYLRPDQVTPELVRFQSKIIGRVMDHDKAANYAFTEADFLPVGTKPGIVAGIPAGKRAMRVPLDRIPGLVGLAAGDRFDVISALAINAGAGGLGAGGLYGRQLELQAQLTNWQRQATVRVIVQSGQIVQAVTTRLVPVSSSTMTSGLVTRTRPVQEVVIAVDPVEVSRLTEALVVGADLSCVPRSGRPEDDPDSVTPESDPWSPYGGTVRRPKSGEQREGVSGTAAPGTFGAGFTPVETISGNKREIVAAPVKR
jgi:Flp pilus assembly protein CpaB